MVGGCYYYYFELLYLVEYTKTNRTNGSFRRHYFTQKSMSNKLLFIFSTTLSTPTP